MKVSLVAFLFASVSARTITSHNAKSLIRSARRLEDQEDAEDGQDAEEEEEEEMAFLMNYKLKMRSCVAGQTIRNAENGEYENNAVVFRLCPDNGECDDADSDGCGAGYGDYVVGLSQFVNSYIEDQEENMQQDDNFDIAEYAECREYENDNQDDGNAVQYYVGPACSEDGTDIVLQMFSDEGCQTVPEDVTFEEVSNGWTLPYSEGGLVSSYCTSCIQQDDDGNSELKELCERLYEDAGKCESEMETFSYYGKQEDSCATIQQMVPSKSSGGGKFGWFIFVAVAASFAGYVVWWKKKKAANNAANEGLMN